MTESEDVSDSEGATKIKPSAPVIPVTEDATRRST